MSRDIGIKYEEKIDNRNVKLYEIWFNSSEEMSCATRGLKCASFVIYTLIQRQKPRCLSEAGDPALGKEYSQIDSRKNGRRKSDGGWMQNWEQMDGTDPGPSLWPLCMMGWLPGASDWLILSRAITAPFQLKDKPILIPI